jgi:tripartite-type tricarboxylate transporter receptor subunit TctC
MIASSTGKIMLSFNTISRLRTALFLSVGSLAFAAFAAWPEKPIRIVVAFPPGSSTDIIARTFSVPLGEALGQPIIIENKPGAGGNIATTGVARSAPDGYTFLMHSVAYAVNPSLYSKAGYEVGKDLSAVALTGVSPNIFYVHPSVKVNNLGELLALAKNEKLSYASSGNGTTTHLGAELFFRNLAKVEVQHVPYAPASAANAVVSNQVPLGSTSIPPVVQLARAGKVRPIAVTSARRSSALPEVPTVAELGYPGFEANTWFALLAPAGTPEEILQRINIEINRLFSNRGIAENFASQSLEATRLDRAATEAYIAAEAKKWAAVVQQTGARVD